MESHDQDTPVQTSTSSIWQIVCAGLFSFILTDVFHQITYTRDLVTKQELHAAKTELQEHIATASPYSHERLVLLNKLDSLLAAQEKTQQEIKQVLKDNETIRSDVDRLKYNVEALNKYCKKINYDTTKNLPALTLIDFINNRLKKDQQIYNHTLLLTRSGIDKRP